MAALNVVQKCGSLKTKPYTSRSLADPGAAVTTNHFLPAIVGKAGPARHARAATAAAVTLKTTVILASAD
ncbi:hypothetical protein [Massilia sp. PWRC2]|uniref:hypothetical protein n=1 Tax=Massilia sp. PWRC2 TaxID=2804626 RepID=UPI003CEF86EB